MSRVVGFMVSKMKEDIARKVTYFKYCGKANTEKVLHAVKLRCKERDKLKRLNEILGIVTIEV